MSKFVLLIFISIMIHIVFRSEFFNKEHCLEWHVTGHGEGTVAMEED